MKNKWLSFIPLLLSVVLGYFFFRQSFFQPKYQGLPTVPCIDYTKKIVQDYSLNISIWINGKQYQVPKNFGHDYGNCLHNIYSNDSTGKIFIKTNQLESFNLGNVFDIWHATFNENQIFSYIVGNGHYLEVYLNGQKVKSGRETPLLPNTSIKIVYK